MIGKTNSYVGSIKGEKLNISLITNQTDHSDLIGASIIVRYLNKEIKKTWNGNMIVIEIPASVNYTIEVSEVDGYKTPNSYSGVANEDNSLPLTFQYNTEILTLNVKGLTSGFTITIDGIGTQTVTSGTYKIPYGTSYTIRGSVVTGYNISGTGTFTAGSAEVTRTITYTLKTYTLTVTVSGLSSGFSLTVKYGSNTKTQTATSATYTVTYGLSWSVLGNYVSGYYTPTSYSGTTTGNKTVTITYDKIAIDLSALDIYGNPTSQNTANCYVIKEAGKYKFPCIYGNAISNGSTNSTAYTNNGGTNSHDFVNYKGNLIVNPWISIDTGETITSAQLSIADTDNIFTDISVDGDYIKFKVNSIPDTGANGIISIKDSNGVIMWNWHIWVWTDDLTPVTITNNTGVEYDILPVNLASKKSFSFLDESKYDLLDWYYQFGRPTPLAPENIINSTDNNILNYTIASTASGLLLGIQNPTTFYILGGSLNNWFINNSEKTYNLWDQACTSTGCSDNNVVKTVYDPCPPGFKIPNGNTFTYFSIDTVINKVSDEGSAGVYFKKNSSDTVGVFFPLSPGYIDPTNGEYSNLADSRLWLSASLSQNEAHMFYCISNRFIYPQSEAFRAHAFAVRPVAES